MGWGKDPIGLVIKVSKLGVVPATRNPSTARGVGEGEAEVGGWRKERQLYRMAIFWETQLLQVGYT